MTWPWPADNATERARRIANSLVALLPPDERKRHVATAHRLGETWLGATLIHHELDEVVTTTEAAGLIHMKPSTIRKWHSLGYLSAVRRGRYRVRDVLDCSAERRRARLT